MATILAAHCTDAAVNRVTPGFFHSFPTPNAILGKSKDELVPLLPGIPHTGKKVEYILNWAHYLVEHGGDIEPSIAAITARPLELFSTS